MNKQPMLSRTFIALASLLSSLVFQVNAGSQAGATGSFQLFSGNFEVQTSVIPSHVSPIGTVAARIAPWAPADENIIFVAPVSDGDIPGRAIVGWTFPPNGQEVGTPSLDGWARNITLYYTPPSGIEEWVFT
jgi:hypothetical protein